MIIDGTDNAIFSYINTIYLKKIKKTKIIDEF